MAYAKLALFPESEAVKRAVAQLLTLPENREDLWYAAAPKAAAQRQSTTTAERRRIDHPARGFSGNMPQS